MALLASTEKNIVEKDLGQSRNLLHHRRTAQGLLPLLTLFTSIDGGGVRGDIKQNGIRLLCLQKTQVLLPSMAPITSTDGGTVGSDIGQLSSRGPSRKH